MINPALRLCMVITAWAFVALGAWRAFELLSGPAQDFEHAAWSLLGNFVQAGILVTLVSIDKRIENRSV